MTQENKHRPLPMAYIQEHLALCNESPSGLKWLIPGYGRRKDKQAGSLRGGDYRVKIDGQQYLVHRVIYALYSGEDPGDLQVDHSDGDHANNRPDNLRAATNSQNNMNKGSRSDNTSGIPGVSWDKVAHKWQARVRTDGISASKRFKDLTEAAAWITAKRLELFGEFAPENRQGPIENTAQVTTEPVQGCLFD